MFSQDDHERIVAAARPVHPSVLFAYDPSRAGSVPVRLPLLNEFKGWLERNVSRVLKGSLTRRAMEYIHTQSVDLSGGLPRAR